MNNNEPTDEQLQVPDSLQSKPAAPTEDDITASKLAAIESENPSGEFVAARDEQPEEPTVTEESQKPAVVEAVPIAPVPNEPVRRKIVGLFTSKKQALVTAAIAGVLVLGGGAAAFALTYQPPVQEAYAASSVATPKPVAKLGVIAAVADGTVTYQKASGSEWVPLAADTQLAEGSQVKTAADSRAVLLFDDGSALRLDANTTVGLTSLAATDVKVAQVEGTAYSRVVPSERSYTVIVDGVSYKALGTAFSTVKSPTEKGVRVFQSQVKVEGVDTAVAEGKQYFNDNANVELKNKVTDIDVDAMADSTFVQWNLAEDEKAENFKDKLGILAKVKERAEQKAKEQEAATLKAKADAEAKARAEAEKTTAKDSKDESKEKVTHGAIAAAAQGATIRWTYTGKATYGYKLVYSKNTNTPTFGTDEAIYYSDPTTTSGKLSSKDGLPSGTYWVRICAYTNGTENEPCVDYSNTVWVQK